MVNIYSQTSDPPNVYSELRYEIYSYLNTHHTIIRGDFNLVMNTILDSMNYKHLNNLIARMGFLKSMEIFTLRTYFGKIMHF